MPTSAIPYGRFCSELAIDLKQLYLIILCSKTKRDVNHQLYKVVMNKCDPCDLMSVAFGYREGLNVRLGQYSLIAADRGTEQLSRYSPGIDCG